MELQFDRTTLACLQTLTRQIQSQELTQEVRLPEGLPDIGRVLGCWAQVLLRGKEWRSGSIGASGGVMAWVLYAPEEGGKPRCVESWLPFQLKWEIPDTRHDGSILLQPILRGTDARSLSSRKLMVRIDLGMLAEALVPSEAELSVPGEIPEDVQLLRRTYPMTIPKEAGEKAFAIEEDLTIPASSPQPEKLIRFALRPELIDKKVMADKVIFRGVALLHLLYRSEDGQLHTWDHEIPFSQYAQLDNEYGENSTTCVMPMVTDLELDLNENGSLRLKAGLTGQYIVYDRQNVEVVEDAYSLTRPVTLQTQRLRLPVILDSKMETVHAEQAMEADASAVADVEFYSDAPRAVQEDDMVDAEMNGQFQLLYYDANGELQNATTRWDGTWDMTASQSIDVQLSAVPSGIPQAVPSGGSVSMRADVLLDAVSKSQQGIEMVTGLELGEQIPPDPNRPSLILRRAGEEGLWQIAKETGSTVERILQANGLSQEPDTGKMLLIPVS